MRTTSSPELFPQTMGGAHPLFEGKALGTRLICKEREPGFFPTRPGGTREGENPGNEAWVPGILH